MKELLLQYAQYNIWANKRIIDALLQLPEGAAEMHINSSFTTIWDTVIHTWSAEDTWMQRLDLVPQPIWQQAIFKGTFAGACNNWEAASATIAAYVEAQENDDAFKKTVAYSDRSGNPYNTPIFQILQHVFNHSTYHRGQLVTMLRQAGATAIPGTDFIGFARLK